MITAHEKLLDVVGAFLQSDDEDRVEEFDALEAVFAEQSSLAAITDKIVKVKDVELLREAAAEDADLSCWTIAEEPNPHPVGSWHWAGFEHNRGKVVQRQGRLPYEPGHGLWVQRFFTGADFTAKDWEIAE